MDRPIDVPQTFGSPPLSVRARVRITLAASIVLLLTSSVGASDGVIDVNQAAALGGSITPGDGAGFPVSITLSGSYRLTGNLDVRGQTGPSNRDAISIDANYVTLDLNGFAIIGPASCPDPPGTCSTTGSGVGIKSSMTNVTVHNGSVRGMGNDGVRLTGSVSRVESLRVRHNGGDGIDLGGTARVHRCLADHNGAAGLRVQNNAAIHTMISHQNLGAGIVFAGGSTVEDCVARFNAGAGISNTELDGSGRVADCVVDTNSGDGIASPDSAIAVSDSAIAYNLVGVRAEYGSTILRSTIYDNSSSGFALGLHAGYGQSVITLNGAGETQGVGGIQMGSNFCGSNTTCP